MIRGRLKHATFQISVILWEGYFAPLPMMNSKKYTGNFYIPEQPVVRRARRGSLVKITQITQLHPGSSNSPTTHTIKPVFSSIPAKHNYDDDDDDDDDKKGVTYQI